jgi:NitT/TauT family transport system substrate-binding protein
VAAGLIDRPPLSMIALPAHRGFGDLRGGRIGTSSLTEGTRHVAERMLAAHGLAYPDDYDFALEGSHVERWKALQAGTIDAALQMVPYDEMAADAGFTNLGPVTEDFALNAVCVSTRSSGRQVVTAFLRALAEAAEWFRGNVEESAALAAAHTSIEPRYALRACQAVAADRVIPRDLRPGRAALAAAIDALRRGGLIPAETPDPAAAALDWSYLDERLRRRALTKMSAYEDDAGLAAAADAACARYRSPWLTGLKANDRAMRAVNTPVAA